MSSAPFRAESQRADQRGLSLVVVLLLLVVIGLSSALAIRGAANHQRGASTQKAKALAFQSAEVAMKYCVDDVQAVTGPTLAIQQTDTDDPRAWTLSRTWDGSPPMAFEVPLTLFGDALETRPARAPQCLIEEFVMRSNPPRPSKAAPRQRAFLITVRGFSPDYSVGIFGSVSGSEAWLQSTVRVFE